MLEVEWFQHVWHVEEAQGHAFGLSEADRGRFDGGQLHFHQRIDAAYAELGPFATVMARRVLDGVEAVLKQAGGESGLDIRAKVTLERLLTDYLPTTLRSYARVRSEPGARPEVERQLVHLATAVEETLVAVRDNNLQDLQVQGDFLDTKFNGSDLRL